MGEQISHTDHTDERQRKEFRYDGNIAHQGTAAHAAIVHGYQRTDEKRDRNQPGNRLRRLGDELRKVGNEEIHRRRVRREAGEQIHPAHLDSGQPAEGIADVEVASTAAGKL